VTFKSASASKKYGCTYWCSVHQFSKQIKAPEPPKKGDKVAGEGKDSEEDESDGSDGSEDSNIIDLDSCTMRMRLGRVKGTDSFRFKSSASKLRHHHLLENKEVPFFREISISVGKDRDESIERYLRAIKGRIRSTADIMLVYNALRRLCHVLGVT